MPEPVGPTGKPRRGFLHGRSLYVNVVTAFAGLLLISLGVVILYDYTSNSRIVLKLSDQIMARATISAVEKCQAYLQPASVLAETSARILRSGALPIEDWTKLEAFEIEVLKAYPQVCMFYLGDENGNFLKVTRETNDTISTQIITNGPTSRQVKWLHRDAAFRVVREEMDPENPYDPRTRPWYRGAKETGGLFWTDVYAFYTGLVPGITCAAPVMDPAGKFHGVLGVDIDLGAISEFLRTLNLGPSGRALILNEAGAVVAFQNVKRILAKEGADLRTVRLEELDVPPLQAATRQYAETGAQQGVVKVQRKRYLYSIRDFSVAANQHWKLVVAVAEDDFVGELKVANRIALILGLCVLIWSVVVAARLSRSIIRPIVQLTDEANRIRDLDLEGEVTVHSHIKEIDLMSQAIAAMKSSLHSFQRYVPSELVRQLMRSGEQARLGGHRRELTLFFSDVAGFTPISERMTAEELMIHLSEYLDELTRIILKHGGTVDKYIGDAIMAFWGAPMSDEQHARRACDAALLCQRKVAELNQRWSSQGKAPLPTRIGIHTGESIVGNLGSSERMNYTALGDVVNFASRLEGVNKFYGTRILISQTTFEKVSGHFLCRPLGKIGVKGKSVAFPVYELMASKAEDPSRQLERFCSEFARGIEAYQRRAWTEAVECFAKLSREHPDDIATRLYLSRCEQFQNQPPPADWQAADFLDEK